MQAEFGPATPDDVTTELAEGVPERILIAQSAGADLMVLGEAAPTSLTGRPEGPVIRACLAHASCPVVIVGSANDARAPARRDLADAVIA
jgi:nucleotide-binding universal stress UspA family protein